MRLPYELREAELQEQQFNDEGQTGQLLVREGKRQSL